jgi:hypothetical protein
VADSHVSTDGLKLRLLEQGVFEHRCGWCEGTRWLEGPIPLQLDHVDGDRTNNRIENLSKWQCAPTPQELQRTSSCDE